MPNHPWLILFSRETVSSGNAAPAGNFPARPDLAFRIGITGTRAIAAAEEARLIRQVSDVLGVVREAVVGGGSQLAGQEKVYDYGADKLLVLRMRFLSPLARGADRLAARAALDQGYELHVPMPFARAEYEKDFADAADLAEFQTLLHLAGNNRLEMDGDRETARLSSYEAAGRYVVRNCDLLIAIWDGELEGNGRGGTADIVRYAATTGIPIWWLHAVQDQPPVWIADIQDLRDPPPVPPPAKPALLHYISALIHPPAPCRRHHHSVTDKLAHIGHGTHVTPMAEYFAGHVAKDWFGWRAHDGLMQLMAGSAGKTATDAEPEAGTLPQDKVGTYWATRFQPADFLAIQYARRYRSGYVWTFMFGTLAVVLGACALVCSLYDPNSTLMEHLTVGFAAGELTVLLLILVLVCSGLRGDWHEHSIEFRLFAELCRKQQALGSLGWTLPVTAIRQMTDAHGGVPDRSAWVAWLFAAEQRSAPFPTGALADAALGQPRRIILDELISGQCAYHASRAARDSAGGHRLAVIGELFFITVLTLVFIKLGLDLVPGFARAAWPLGLLATILPAFSAAFVGIRAYSEVPLLAVQSLHMEAALRVAHARVSRLDKERPLVSQDLGAEAAAVATLMLQDLEGWARLFRVKSLEAG